VSHYKSAWNGKSSHSIARDMALCCRFPRINFLSRHQNVMFVDKRRRALSLLAVRRLCKCPTSTFLTIFRQAPLLRFARLRLAPPHISPHLLNNFKNVPKSLISRSFYRSTLKSSVGHLFSLQDLGYPSHKVSSCPKMMPKSRTPYLIFRLILMLYKIGDLVT
jgi:hypothetical protein